MEDLFHQRGECSGGIGEPEGHLIEFEMPSVAHPERCLSSVFFLDGYLAVPILQVEGGEPLSPM